MVEAAQSGEQVSSSNSLSRLVEEYNADLEKMLIAQGKRVSGYQEGPLMMASKFSKSGRPSEYTVVDDSAKVVHAVGAARLVLKETGLDVGIVKKASLWNESGGVKNSVLLNLNSSGEISPLNFIVVHGSDIDASNIELTAIRALDSKDKATLGVHSYGKVEGARFTPDFFSMEIPLSGVDSVDQARLYIDPQKGNIQLIQTVKEGRFVRNYFSDDLHLPESEKHLSEGLKLVEQGLGLENQELHHKGLDAMGTFKNFLTQPEFNKDSLVFKNA